MFKVQCPMFSWSNGKFLFRIEKIVLPQPKRVGGLPLDIDPHALGLQVLAQRLGPTLTAEARTLVPAKRRHVAGHAVTVDPDRSGFELFRHCQRTTDAARPD